MAKKKTKKKIVRKKVKKSSTKKVAAKKKKSGSKKSRVVKRQKKGATSEKDLTLKPVSQTQDETHTTHAEQEELAQAPVVEDAAPEESLEQVPLDTISEAELGDDGEAPTELPTIEGQDEDTEDNSDEDVEEPSEDDDEGYF